MEMAFEITLSSNLLQSRIWIISKLRPGSNFSGRTLFTTTDLFTLELMRYKLLPVHFSNQNLAFGDLILSEVGSVEK